MKLKVILQHSSARKSNRYSPYKEWASPRLDYWSARVGKHASVPQLDNTLKYWTLHSGNVDQKGRLTLLPKRIDLSTPEEGLGLSLQSDEQASKSDTTTEEVSFPRTERDSESEHETRLEDEFLLNSKDGSTSVFEKKDYEAKQCLDNKSEYQTRLEKEFVLKSKDRSNNEYEIKQGLETNLTNREDHTVAASSEGEGPLWWPSPDALDFLNTHSRPDEFGRKYRIWSELETSEGSNTNTVTDPKGESYISADQSLWYANNVLATGRDILYRPVVEGWREQINEWSEVTRLINESATRRLVPTLQFPTHVSEWLARVDFRHESVRRKIDYTRPKPKSLREKPGCCARHRPYVRKTRNNRETLAEAGRTDLSRVQLIDNF